MANISIVRTKRIIPLLIVAFLVILAGLSMAVNVPLRENKPVDQYPAGIEEPPPSEASVAVSREQAINAVKKIWQVPKADVKAVLAEDKLTGDVFWLLT